MAKIIEFYIPSNFRKAEKQATKTRGQVIEFAPRRKKSA
jgi:hypothetical protein